MNRRRFPAQIVSEGVDFAPRAEARLYRGEAIVVLWYAHDDGEHVRAINRVVDDGARIASWRISSISALGTGSGL